MAAQGSPDKASKPGNMADKVASKVHRFFQYVTQHNQAAAQQAAAAAQSPGTHEGLGGSGSLHGPLGRSSIHAPSGPALAAPAADMPKLRIGVCAMDKKAQSKPMKEIMSRLVAAGEFEVVVFGDDVILDAPIEEWPECDCLLSWYSDGFPLRKAQAYTDLRKPFLVNDLHMQDVLQDRRQVYKLLVENAIPVPTHIIVDREGLAEGQDPTGFVEEEDFVELNGERIYKPFVEKPASGEDHNIYIYYPHSMGGGVKRLFRKVDDKSSCYDSDHPGTVRRSDSYIYEEFLPTGGTDVKVYTVGPRYAHAEARKSPVVDGKVLRSADGKEMRFPVLLSPQEKEVARMVCLAFGQKVCGFDLLRSEKGKSYVCDVNGWSFVKNSRKYYDDTAGILRSIILSALAPHRLASVPAAAADDGCYPHPDEVESYYTMFDESLLPQVSSLTDLASMAELSGIDAVEARRTDERSKRDELRCVLAVIRHGDRTPKQKMKMRVTQPELLALFDKYKDGKGKQAKLKSPLQLQELLDITRALLKRLEEPSPPDLSDEEREARDEAREKFRIVRTVLEQGGQFSGINRKVQLKPTRWGPPPAAPPTPAAAGGQLQESRSGSAGGAVQGQGQQQQQQQQGQQQQVPRVASQLGVVAAGNRETAGGSSSTGSGGKEAAKGPVEEAMLILKYGGVLTHAGRQQAWDLGRTFRLVMYPRYGSAGGGLLRLHSTYRHDLKIYSSDEGRVQVSAAAFTKGLLDLEGSSLTPILVSLVQKDASMLDAFGKGASEEIRVAKNALYAQMTYDPATASSAFTPLPGATPTLCSPQLSPKAMSRASSGNVARDNVARTAAGAAGGRAGAAGPAAAGAAPVLGRNTSAGATVAAASTALTVMSLGSSTSDGDNSSSANRLPRLSIPEAPLPMPAPSPANGGPLTAGSGALGSGSVPADADYMRQEIPAMPANPLQHLHRLVQLMKVLVTQLREMCLRERPDPRRARYSSLSQDPREWEQEVGQPCSGERLLLMFDRWQKLLKSFYSEKKGRFDISKVPDIYDSAKYDVIHNSHLGLPCLEELYKESKILADAVIPNEYGIDPQGQLAIGAKICTELLGKLIADLESMREESVATMAQDMASSSEADGNAPFEQVDTELGRASLQDDAMMAASGKGGPHHTQHRGSQQSHAGGGPDRQQGSEDEAQGGEPEAEGDDYDRTPETIHRLCPTYASDINSPLRHVRTRIYFTSESHMHSLLNVLRFCHLAPHAQQQQQSPSPEQHAAAPQGGTQQPAAPQAPSTAPHAHGQQQQQGQQEGQEVQPLVCDEGADLLRSLRELDYLTHIVFRLYENKSVPPNDPERFRVEILFSPGAAHDPTEVLPLRSAPEHTLPPFPRAQLHNGEGARLDDFERLLMPFASRRFANTSSYALQVGLKAPSQFGGASGAATQPSPRKQ